MVEQIPDLPDNVVGFTASGTVTVEGYESVIIPAVEAQFSSRSKARFLYHLGDDFSGFEAGAMWDDAKPGLRHFSCWEKIALVTDLEWVRTAVKIDVDFVRSDRRHTAPGSLYAILPYTVQGSRHATTMTETAFWIT